MYNVVCIYKGRGCNSVIYSQIHRSKEVMLSDINQTHKDKNHYSLSYEAIKQTQRTMSQYEHKMFSPRG